MNIPFVSKFIEQQVQNKVRKLIGNYFPTDLIDKKFWYNDENYAPETKTDFALSFEKEIWVYCCIYTIANNAAQIPLKLYVKDSEDEVLNGPLWELINIPNPETSYNDFIEAFFTYAELTGDSFIELNDNTLPTMMKVLRSYWVDCNYNSAKKMYQYRYKPMGSPEIVFDEGKIIHFKYFHPNSDLYGMSAISTITSDIIIDKNATRYTQDFFAKGGMINLYLKVKANLQDFEFKRLKQETATNVAGLKNANTIPVLDNDAELKSAGFDVNQILMKSTKDSCRDEILAAFGVPPIMLGFLSGIETYNNSDIQKKSFWEVTMKPKLMKAEAFFNRTLFWRLGHEVKFDLSGVAALKDDEQKQAQTLSTLKTGGIITVNEAREQLGYEPIVGGDVLQTQTVNPVTMSFNSDTLKKNLRRSINVELIKAAKAQGLKEQEQAQAAYEKGLKPVFNSILESVLAVKIDKSNQIQKSDYRTQIIQAVDNETKTMMRELAKISDEQAQEIMQNNYTRLTTKKVMPADLKRTLDRQTQKHIVKWAEESTNSIINTLKGKLETVIKNSDTTDLPEFTKALRTVFEGTDKTYPQVVNIARTESSRIANSTRQEVAKGLGFTKKTWLHAPISGSDRDWHVELDGVTVGIDETFTVEDIQMKYPGDPAGGPHNNVNCRCSIFES